MRHRLIDQNNSGSTLTVRVRERPPFRHLNPQRAKIVAADPGIVCEVKLVFVMTFNTEPDFPLVSQRQVGSGRSGLHTG